ncbi:hypothetical protein J7L70_02605, partial [Candidatus Bathyarchaeota archaeon]|nr:hypothetical protein [Candidatus Bathyarchaeota archaeon]
MEKIRVKMLPSPTSLIIGGMLFIATIFVFDCYIIFSELYGEGVVIRTTVLLMCLLCIAALTIGEILDILAFMTRKISLALALSTGFEFENQKNVLFLINDSNTVLFFPYIMLALIVLHVLDTSRIFTYSISVIHKIVIVVTVSAGFTTLLMSEYPTVYLRFHDVVSKVNQFRRITNELFSKVVEQAFSAKRILLTRLPITLLYVLMTVFLFQELITEEDYLLLGVTALASMIIVGITTIISVRSWSQLLWSWERPFKEELTDAEKTPKERKPLGERESLSSPEEATQGKAVIIQMEERIDEKENGQRKTEKVEKTRKVESQMSEGKGLLEVSNETKNELKGSVE